MDIDLLELQPGEEVFEEYFTDTEGLLGDLDSEPVIQELDKNEPEVLKIPERQKIVFEVPSLTVDAPKPSVHERLGPRVGQNASSSKEKEWLSPEEWEIFRAERKKGRKENRKLKEQAVLSRAKPRKRTLPEVGPSVVGFPPGFQEESDYPSCSDSEDELPIWKQKKAKSAQPDESWDALHHSEKCGMEFALYHVAMRTPTLMPELSLALARKMIALNGRYFVKQTPDQKVYEFKAKTKRATDNHPGVVQFVEEAKEWRMLSFDTEGDGKLPGGRVFICFGSPVTGMVLCFHDLEDIPESIRTLLADYRYAKIQSGISGDVKLLQGLGVKVRGLVDTGTVMALLDPKSVRFGAKTQIQKVWGSGHHQDWLPFFMSDYEKQQLSDKNKRHSFQDVLTPFAILIKTAIQEAEMRMYGPADDIFPIINEALELSYSKSPKDLRHPSDGKITSEAFTMWHPPNVDSIFSLNGQFAVQRIRKARGDFVERFENRPAHLQETFQEKRAFALKMWPNNILPSSNDMRWGNLGLKQYDARCHNCASRNHRREFCPLEKTACVYPHGPASHQHGPHSTLMCPNLHDLCTECYIRGHCAADHAAGMNLSPYQLRQKFLQFAHLGRLTCLPFLYGERRLQSYHWVAGLNVNRLPRNPQDLWIYTGTGSRLSQELLDSLADLMERARDNLNSNPMTYKPRERPGNCQRLVWDPNHML